MSREHPQTPSIQHRHSDAPGHDARQEDIRLVASRVGSWLSASGEDPPEHPESVDEQPRRFDPVTPSATRIGHAEGSHDVDGRLRALHAERRAAFQGNPERTRALDVLRVTQAVCNSLDLTPWERDRVLGVVRELDGTALDDGRAIPHIALVVARRVVDAERRAWLGLDDSEYCADQPPERLAALADRLTRLTDGSSFDGEAAHDGSTYDRLREDCGLTDAAAARIDAALDRELDEATLREAVLGRSPHRDPHLPVTADLGTEK